MTIRHSSSTVALVTVAILFVLPACEGISEPELPESTDLSFVFESAEPAPDRLSIGRTEEADVPARVGRFRVDGFLIDTGTFEESIEGSYEDRSGTWVFAERRLAGRLGTLTMICDECLRVDGDLREGSLRISNATGQYEPFAGTDAWFDLTGSDETGSEDGRRVVFRVGG